VSWFVERKLALRTGRRAAALDAARRTVTLDDGQEVSFDRLLIATGATPRRLAIPGADLPNLFYLRTIEDVGRLHHAMEQVERLRRDKARVAVIGGGLLGVELSASLKQMGLAVDLIVDSTHPWPRFSGDAAGNFVTHYLQSKGVNVHLGQRPARLEGDGRVQRVLLSDNSTITCDFAIAAVGAIPNKDLLRGTPITAEKAILVDSRCQTNIEGIYAAGDCCAVFDPLFSKHRILDHWNGAVTTGKLAGANMAGDPKSYNAVSSFFSDVFDCSITVYGEPRLVDRRIVRGNPTLTTPSFLEFGLSADNRITQILSVNHGEQDILKQLVQSRANVQGREERLKEPTTPLAMLLKSEI
ncbi:MAG TPA: FAD-dependent oxidoreductase, partial [Tepidisphaeraceae bacterium]